MLCKQSATARRLPCLWLVILLLIPLPAQQRLATVPGMLAAPNPRSETPPGHWFIVSKSHLIHSRFCGNEWNCLQNHTRPGGELCSIVQCLFPTISHVWHRISFSRFGTTVIILSTSRNPSTICPDTASYGFGATTQGCKVDDIKSVSAGWQRWRPMGTQVIFLSRCMPLSWHVDWPLPSMQRRGKTQQLKTKWIFQKASVQFQNPSITNHTEHLSYVCHALLNSIYVISLVPKNGTHQLVLNGVDNGMIRKKHQWVQNSTRMTCIFFDFHTNMVAIHPLGPSPQQSVCHRFGPTWKVKVGQTGLGWQHSEFFHEHKDLHSEKTCCALQMKVLQLVKGPSTSEVVSHEFLKNAWTVLNFCMPQAFAVALWATV